MWKGYGYREGDTFSGVTIGVRVRKKGTVHGGTVPFFFTCFSFSRAYSIKSCKKRLTSFSYKAGFMFQDRMWVASPIGT